jgi:Ca2+/Na+ antiporter
MELRELWKKLESEKLSKPVVGAVHIQKKSKHPVEKLKRTYFASTLFAIFFLFCFIALLFLFHEPVVKTGIAVVVAIYIFFVYINFKTYKRIDTKLLLDQNLKSALEETYQFIKDNIRFQERFSLYIYPLCGAAGMLMGLATGGGEATKYLDNNFVLGLLVVVPLLLTPPCWLLAKWLHKVSYGASLKQLKELIDEMEKPETPN